jgi:hypothetical protein
MWQTIGLAFLAGALGGNAIPHFVKGITKETYPSVFGSTPVVNLLLGWSGLFLAVLAGMGANFTQRPVAGLIAAALGVLLLGLFHATVGTFGPRAVPRPAAAESER